MDAYDAFAKSVANDPELLHKVNQSNLLVGLEIAAMRMLVPIDMAVNTCWMGYDADYGRD